MNRLVAYLVIILFISIVSFSQPAYKRNSDCYREKIRLNTTAKEYKDTLVLLRNYIVKNDEKRIICNNMIIDEKMNHMVWKSKYLEVSLEFQNRHNRFSIIQYKIDNQRDTIVSYYTCERKTKETVEMTRFKIAHNKISEINILPGIVNVFTPVEEFDKMDFDEIE